MIVISRQRDESIIIGDGIEVRIVDIRGDRVRLGIAAPKGAYIVRREEYDTKSDEDLRNIPSAASYVGSENEGLLVISRHRDEMVQIGSDVEVTVVDIRVDRVRLGMTAPMHLSVHRKEVYEALMRERKKADAKEPKNEEKVLHRASVRISKSLQSALQAKSARERISMNALVIEALNAWLGLRAEERVMPANFRRDRDEGKVTFSFQVDAKLERHLALEVKSQQEMSKSVSKSAIIEEALERYLQSTQPGLPTELHDQIPSKVPKSDSKETESLGKLDAVSREVLEALALFKVNASVNSISTLMSNRSAEEVQKSLEQLKKRGFVESSDGKYKLLVAPPQLRSENKNSGTLYITLDPSLISREDFVEFLETLNDIYSAMGGDEIIIRDDGIGCFTSTEVLA